MKIKNAHKNREWVAAPYLVPTPEGFPYSTAICTVDLPDGCRPPSNGMKRRLATGRGPSDETACFIALAEAAERYSIQFFQDLPRQLSPFLFVGEGVGNVALEEIALGAPHAHRRVTSKGAAAGVDRQDAAGRALLEMLEHHYSDAYRAGFLRFGSLSTERCDCVQRHSVWLRDRLRRLDLRALKVGGMFWVVLARCSDFDGGRATEGTAAAVSRDKALTSAVEEAIFQWRNMIALEERAVSADMFSGAERDLFVRYRGAAPRWELPAPGETEADGRETVCDSPSVEDLMAHLAEVTGRSVGLFDMTRPETGFVTVKAHIAGPE